MTATTMMMMMTMTATMLVNGFETPRLPAFQHVGCALSRRVSAGRAALAVSPKRRAE
jgi:hypothetical protein